MAVRLGQNLLRRQRRERALDEGHLAEDLDLEDGAELDQLKALYRRPFNEAFVEALASLSSRDRNLLRYRYVERWTTERIATLYRVHRMTVSRWYVRLQATLLEQTRKGLAARVGARPEDVNSLLRLLQSQLDLSIRRHLDSNVR